MGTNFYWREATCPTCKHSKRQFHIGKSSIGWTFSFQALKADESPTGRPVTRASDWWEILSGDGEIRDEYGDLHSLEDLKRLVDEKARVAGVRRHCDEYSHSYGAISYADADGHSFSEGSFS